MTKKIFAMFLAVLMVVSMLPTTVFAANDCPAEHTKDNCDCTVVQVVAPDCDSYGYTTYKCNKCKKTFADSIVPATGEHNWVEAEDKAPTCGVAGETGGQECEDCGLRKNGTPVKPLFKEGTACEYKDLNPNIDCTTGGVKTFECVACGHSYTVTVKKDEAGHEWQYDKMTVKVEATADKAGVLAVECKKCHTVKELEWFADHDCAQDLVERAEVKATCTTDGTIKHYECRVCGKVYADDKAETELRKDEVVKYDGIIVKAEHTPTTPIVKSCNDKSYTCSKCDEKFVVKGEHDLPKAGETGYQYVAPTCTTKGYITQTCKNAACRIPYVTEIPALGHIEVTVSVPATCHTYAYTFTACMRTDCVNGITGVTADGKGWLDADNGNLHFDITLPYTVADKLVADTVEYNLTFSVEDEMLYTAGAYIIQNELYILAFGNDYYEAYSSADLAKAFYLETYKNYKDKDVADAFRLYTEDNGTKTYYIVDADGNFTIATAAPAAGDEMFWSWNETLGLLTFHSEAGEFFLAATEADTELYAVVALPVEYYGYLAVLEMSAVRLSYRVEDGVQAGGISLVDVDVDYKGKFNSANHDWAEIRVEPTCSVDGYLTTYCKNSACKLTKTEVLPKGDHAWVKLPGYDPADSSNTAWMNSLTLINGAGFACSQTTITKAASCTEAGWHFEYCPNCKIVERIVDAAKGHKFNVTTEKPVYQAADHLNNGYWYHECARAGCSERKIASEITPWADTYTVWDSYTEASKHHTLVEAEGKGKLYVDGSCSVVGMEMYTCSGCKKVVYVKQVKTVYAEDNTTVLFTYTTGSHVVTPYVAADGPLKNQAVDQNSYYKAPTCKVPGHVYSFECAVCKKTIGNAALGKHEDLKVVDHVFAPKADANGKLINMLEEDEMGPCPNAVPYSCIYCGETEYEVIMDTRDTGLNMCDKTAMKVYVCSCGEEHVQGFYGKFGHDYTNYTVDEEPTHFATGKAHKTCSYCGDVKNITLDKTPHTNKDGDEFTDKCTDTETDRHCVECCKALGHTVKGDEHDCAKKNKKGGYDCDCMIGKECHGEVNTYMNSSCTMLPYYFFVCKDCDETVVTVGDKAFDADLLYKHETLSTAEKKIYCFTDLTKIELDTDEDKVVDTIKLPYEGLNFMGHKPAEVDYVKKNNEFVLDEEGNKIEERYANYVYIENYVWTYYTWEYVSMPKFNDNGAIVYERDTLVLVKHETEPYTAKFEKYEAPSYAADGCFVTKCQICDAKVEQVLAKKSGLGFEMNVANANGQSGFGFGSLMEVTVSINALDAAIYGFEFEVENDMIFVGYEAVNDDFVISVTKPEEVAHNGKALKVAGFAVNSAEGKVQNIEITEKTAVVKLFFRVVGATGKHQFTFANAAATALKNGATKPAVVAANYEKCEFTIRGLMDFNKDGAASAADLYQAMTLITGEHSSGKTYDVTVDLNKDGELTLEDLAAGYDFLVGNYDAVDMLLMGLTEAEAAQLAELLAKAPAHKCINSACQYAADHAFIICPVCYTIQTSEAI